MISSIRGIYRINRIMQYDRVLFRIYDENIVSSPITWIKKLSPTTVKQCICYNSVDLDTYRSCVYGYMYWARPITLSTWALQMNCLDSMVTPVTSNAYRMKVFQEIVIGSIYITSFNHDIYMDIQYTGIYRNMVYVDISSSIYRNAYFRIYDDNIISNIDSWFQSLDPCIKYCVCILTIDDDSDRLCIYGYARRLRLAGYSIWRESLRCDNITIEKGSDSIFKGTHMIADDVVIEGPFARDNL
jgi:hypothetical protein